MVARWSLGLLVLLGFVAFVVACDGPAGGDVSAGSGVIRVTPGVATVFPGEMMSLEAVVEGMSSSDVTWEASAGHVLARGLMADYRAPSRLGKHEVVVRSVVDGRVSARVEVTVEERPDFAPSADAVVLEGDFDEVVAIRPDSAGSVRFASRAFNAQFEVVVQKPDGSAAADALVGFAERADGSGVLVAFDPSGEHGPVLIVGDRDFFLRVLDDVGRSAAGPEVWTNPWGPTWLIAGGVIAFSSIMWTGFKTEQSGQEIEAFFEAGAVDCEYSVCLCKTPNEIAVLHAARAQQGFAIPRVVASGFLVGAPFELLEAAGFLLDVTDLWDNFGFAPVKLSPFSWGEDMLANAKDRSLLEGVTQDSHLLYVVDRFEDPDNGRLIEAVFVIEEECDPGVGVRSAPATLVLSGRLDSDSSVSFSAQLHGIGAGVPAYFVFRNGLRDAVVARHAVSDPTGVVRVSGQLSEFGEGFAFGAGGVVSVAVPTLNLVEEAQLEELVGAPTVAHGVTVTPGSVTGSAPEGGSYSASFELANTGGGNVTVTSIEADAAWISVSPASVPSLAIEDTLDVTVTLNSLDLAPGSYEGEVRVFWGAADGSATGSATVTITFHVEALGATRIVGYNAVTLPGTRFRPGYPLPLQMEVEVVTDLPNALITVYAVRNEGGIGPGTSQVGAVPSPGGSTTVRYGLWMIDDPREVRHDRAVIEIWDPDWNLLTREFVPVDYVLAPQDVDLWLGRWTGEVRQTVNPGLSTSFAARIPSVLVGGAGSVEMRTLSDDGSTDFIARGRLAVDAINATQLQGRLTCETVTGTLYGSPVSSCTDIFEWSTSGFSAARISDTRATMTIDDLVAGDPVFADVQVNKHVFGVARLAGSDGAEDIIVHEEIDGEGEQRLLVGPATGPR